MVFVVGVDVSDIIEWHVRHSHITYIHITIHLHVMIVLLQAYFQLK